MTMPAMAPPLRLLLLPDALLNDPLPTPPPLAPVDKLDGDNDAVDGCGDNDAVDGCGDNDAVDGGDNEAVDDGDDGAVDDDDELVREGAITTVEEDVQE